MNEPLLERETDETPRGPEAPSAPAPARRRPRSKLAALLFALLAGGVGAHKFYLGRPWWGALYLLFSWTLLPLLASLAELVMLLFMRETDFQERYAGPRGGLRPALWGLAAAAVLGVALRLAWPVVVPRLVEERLEDKQVLIRREAEALFRAEEARRAAGRGYEALEALPALGDPGNEKLLLSDEDREAVRDLGWKPPSGWARFAVAVMGEPGGPQALALCAESDLDGDGRRAAVVIFQPAELAGEVAAPDAPCTAAAALAAPEALAWTPERPAGVALEVSPAGVF